MTQPESPTDILGQINSAREQTYQNIATAQGILDQANAAASAAARDRAAIQAIAQQTVRVDTSVGTRVFAGDTMIHGDTGWRNVVSLLDPNNFTLSDVSGYARMRRVGTRVTFAFRIKVLNSPVGSFITTNVPPGLRPAAQMLYIDQGFARSAGLSIIAVSNTNTSDKISININLASIVGETVYGKAEWDADLTWPTSLPGTPA